MTGHFWRIEFVELELICGVVLNLSTQNQADPLVGLSQVPIADRNIGETATEVIVEKYPVTKAMAARNYSEVAERLRMALEEEVCVVVQQPAAGQTEFVCTVERDEMVSWLHLLTCELNFAHEVYFRAVLLLDTFLSSVKIKHRNVRCVTGTCFLIAAKLEETSQPIDNLLEVLVDQYGCECNRRDIQRMELIVMHKLEFDLSRPTAQDFLKSFHSLSLSSELMTLPLSLSKEKHLHHLTLCLGLVICYSSLMQHRPSVLALAVIGCDLKALKCDWLSILLNLQTLAHVRPGELSLCYEAVAAKYPTIIKRYPIRLPPQNQIKQLATCEHDRVRE